MAQAAVAIPIKPGKTEAWKEYADEVTGPRRREAEADHRRFGIHREVAWLQQTPQGDLAILYWEVDDPGKLQEQFSAVMDSDDEFHKWAREHFVDIYGVDPNQPPPTLPEQIFDFRV